MAHMTLDKKAWLSHLGQFDSNINDLMLTIYDKPVCLGYAVGYQTHFYRVYQQYKDAAIKEGVIHISDLDKVCAFLKKCYGDVTIKHAKGGKTLYVTGGNLKMNLPIMDLKSSKLVPTYEKLVKAAEESDWDAFGNDTYTLYGKTQLSDILKLSGLRNIVKNNSDFVVSADATSNEIAISVGKTHSTKLFANGEIKDAEGPKHAVTSNFGPWLLPCLGLVDPTMPTRIHFGDATGLVVRQADNMVKRLLIIIDQQE